MRALIIFFLMTGMPAASWAVSVSANLSITVTSAIPPGFFVATTGSDSNNASNTPTTSPGTGASGPFLTLGRCQTAMRAVSAGNKNCYIRAGTYTPARFTGTGEVCQFDNDGTGSGKYADGTRAGTVVALTSSDNGETWSNYPPDQSGWTNGVSTVIIDGGSTAGQSGDLKNGPIVGSANGIGCGFTLSGANNITIQGLQFQKFVWSAVWGEDSSNLLVQNNTIHDIKGAAFVAGGVSGTCQSTSSSPGWQIKNNYFHDLAYTATEITEGGPGGCFNNFIEAGNVMKNTCTWPVPGGGATGNDQHGGDCGAIYFVTATGTPPSAQNVQILNNYVQDVNAASLGGAINGDCCATGIYFDNLYGGTGASSPAQVTVSGNVVFGITSSVWFLHGGSNILFQNNLFDIDNPTSSNNIQLGFISDNLTGCTSKFNTANNNIYIGDTTGTTTGYHFDGSACTPTSSPIANNFYHNYVGSALVTTGDTNPIQPGSLTGTPINCWAPTIAASSQPTASPVSFPSGLVGGGTWGPPGFVVPQTGTAPSWPHAC